MGTRHLPGASSGRSPSPQGNTHPSGQIWALRTCPRPGAWGRGGRQRRKAASPTPPPPAWAVPPRGAWACGGGSGGGGWGVPRCFLFALSRVEGGGEVDRGPVRERHGQPPWPGNKSSFVALRTMGAGAGASAVTSQGRGRGPAQRGAGSCEGVGASAAPLQAWPPPRRDSVWCGQRGRGPVFRPHNGALCAGDRGAGAPGFWPVGPTFPRFPPSRPEAWLLGVGGDWELQAWGPPGGGGGDGCILKGQVLRTPDTWGKGGGPGCGLAVTRGEDLPSWGWAWQGFTPGRCELNLGACSPPPLHPPLASQ